MVHAWIEGDVLVVILNVWYETCIYVDSQGVAQVETDLCVEGISIPLDVVIDMLLDELDW